MNPPPKLQPALFGGLVAGVLSALPIIGLGNCCCCLWVVAGGLVAASIMQANHPEAITVADGAVAGLLAGVVGAVVLLLISIPIQAVVGPIQERLVERLLENAGDVPPGLRESLQAARFGTGALAVAAGFFFQLFVGLIFSSVGGVFGALMFRRRAVQGAVEVAPDAWPQPFQSPQPWSPPTPPAPPAEPAQEPPQPPPVPRDDDPQA